MCTRFLRSCLWGVLGLLRAFLGRILSDKMQFPGWRGGLLGEGDEWMTERRTKRWLNIAWMSGAGSSACYPCFRSMMKLTC